MRRVIIESPYAGRWWWQRWRNVRYARAALRDALLRGEAPLASHLLYTQAGVLRDDVPAERAQGIAAGFAWRPVADATVVYIDCGISGGMRAGIADALAVGRPVQYRSLMTPHIPIRPAAAGGMEAWKVRGGYTAPAGDGMRPPLPTTGSGVTLAHGKTRSSHSGTSE